jgi:outer membrane protein assembly factor BamB
MNAERRNRRTRAALHSVTAMFAALALAGCGGKPVEEIQSAADVPPAQPIQVTESDWPWWRGPDRNGVARGPAPPTAWSESDHVLWKVDLPGRGHASPIVVGDRVYISTADEAEQTHELLALDRETGKQIWRSEIHRGDLPRDGMHAKSTHANGTPASDGRRVYLGYLTKGEVHATAVDADGGIVWQTPLGPFRPNFGYAPSPVLCESLVIYAADNPGSGYIAAVHRDTGDVVWRHPRKSTSTYATPSIVTVAGKDQLILSGGEQVAAYDPLTGKELWSRQGATDATVGTPVWLGDLVFASGGYPGEETICINAATQAEVWKNDVKAYEPSLLIHGDCLFSFSQGGILYCWDARTGEEHWKKRLGGDVSSSLVAHGDVIYATNENGTTWAFRANADHYEVIAENHLGQEGFATPAIADGRIYIRTATNSPRGRQESLYCIGE